MNKPATALYRLPYTDSPILIAQLQGEPQILTSLQELNGRKGFVIAPFRLTSSTPAVLIRPDLIAKGWNQIHEVLQCHPELKPGIISCGNESVESSEPTLKKHTKKLSDASSLLCVRDNSVNLSFRALRLIRSLRIFLSWMLSSVPARNIRA